MLPTEHICNAQRICIVRAPCLQGVVHITGGGFTENLPRVMPKGLACKVETSSWEWPPLFQWLQKVSHEALSHSAHCHTCLNHVLSVFAHLLVSACVLVVSHCSPVSFRNMP